MDPEIIKAKKEFNRVMFFANIRNNLSYIIGITAVITTIIALLISSGGKIFIDQGSKYAIQVEENSTNIIDIQRQIDKIEEQIASTIFDTDSSITSIEHPGYKKDIEDLQMQVNQLNSLFINNGERAVSLPLLKMEMEKIQSQINVNTKEIENIREIVVETNNQFRWIIGTLALGLISIIIGLFSNKKKNE